jgi:hypothetical protein
MAVTILPSFPPEEAYEYAIKLDDVTYRLRLSFNDRDSYWYCDLFDADDVALRVGIKLVGDWNVLLRWKDTAKRPAGTLLTLSSPPDAEALELEALGRDVVLAYSSGA